MYAIRLWSVRHARGLEAFYAAFENALVGLHPLMKAVGYQRLEKPVAAMEKAVKGVLFDCQMCGQCALSQTGMSCPMNCPKTLRNGPCGGVRANGMCEVKPHMRCVWVEAYAGSERMRKGPEAIRAVRPPVDRTLAGTSSWLRVARQRAEGAAP
ncbi:methylenetetrahydrofolate reductase C-terminal domain-containing protein [Phenylobacterium montanum]|nr:methylenetetrahydrofolate reductase C-terminal domain-containing protein [Caulobacter sp. S6]